ncbi:MAG: signal peptidase II [Candidatus Margulisbacteria bacterium]|nr:signal peptidase II [Candidatus Margulisiibacteriota bacterium]
MIFYGLALLIVIVDQLIKYLIHQSFSLGQSMPLIGDVIKLTYVRNTGAAFSLFVGFSSYLVVVGIFVVLAVIFFHHRLPAKNYVLQTGLAFVLGGSLGNLADRIFRAYVIDYLDITIWPVFNFADIMINVGVILIAFKLFAEEEKKNVSDPV